MAVPLLQYVLNHSKFCDYFATNNSDNNNNNNNNKKVLED